MSIKAVLFDLDGTLLPLDQDHFIKTYFGLLAKTVAPSGYEPKELIATLLEAVEAMTVNDGTRTNEQAFWEAFCRRYPNGRGDEVAFDNFYRNEFQQIKSVSVKDERANGIVKYLKDRGFTVVLATSPMFPKIATESRVEWAGLSKEDFALITTFENSCFSKPNLEYYKWVASKVGVEPCECLMVGNDVDDDMVAKKLGMKVFLLTDRLVNRKNADIGEYPRGSFDQLAKFLEKI